MPSRYVILGAGAVGGVIGAGLLAAGRDVALIARGDHLERMRSHGLRLETPDGPAHHTVSAAGSVADVDLTDDDIVLLAVKSQDTMAALETVIAAGADPIVVCAQNGVANERTASRWFDRVYAAMVWLPATFLRPGVVEAHAAPIMGVVEIGRYPGAVDETAGAIADDLTAAGIATSPRADVMARKHGKLVANVANAVKALTARSDDATRLVQALRREAEATLAAATITHTPLEELSASSRAAMSEIRPIDGRHRGGGSTWQSLARGARSLETDFINGEIARLAIEAGVDAPLNRHLQCVARRALADGVPPKSLAVSDLLPDGVRLRDL